MGFNTGDDGSENVDTESRGFRTPPDARGRSGDISAAPIGVAEATRHARAPGPVQSHPVGCVVFGEWLTGVFSFARSSDRASAPRPSLRSGLVRSRPTIPGVRPTAGPGVWFRRQHQARFRLRLPVVDGRETGLRAGRSRRRVAFRADSFVLVFRRARFAPGGRLRRREASAQECDELC